jgi:hypothetical protein
MECVAEVVAIILIELQQRSDDDGLYRKSDWPATGCGNTDPADLPHSAKSGVIDIPAQVG